MFVITQGPVAKTEMMIRRPIGEVFQAFIDPAVTTRFWFTDSSGKLKTGQRVRWDWRMYGASVNVDVKEIEENKRIVIEWAAHGEPTMVEWVFTPRSDAETHVTITNSGFKGDGDAVVRQALDSMGGFSLVLSGCKALLEHGIALNLIADKAPYAHVKH